MLSDTGMKETSQRTSGISCRENSGAFEGQLEIYDTILLSGVYYNCALWKGNTRVLCQLNLA